MRNIKIALLVGIVWTGNAFAVPETVGLRVTDVTTSSFAVVWMTDLAATPNVEVYSDSAMASRVIDNIVITPMPDAPQQVLAAAQRKGIMKVRVSGLAPNSKYYVRSVTVDQADSSSIGYSALQQVSTAVSTIPYRPADDGSLQGWANDLVAMKIYTQPNDPDSVPGLGDMILLKTPASPYPVTAFVGVGISAPEGIMDLNNLLGMDMMNLMIQGGEKAQISIYRGGVLSTLMHFRKLPDNSGTVAVGEPAKGFFADINMDDKVDDQDFAEFKKQYRTAPNDATYNPDFNFVEDPGGKIDAQDFARFAQEYGRSGVQ